MRRETKPFQIVRAKLPARRKEAKPIVVVADKSELAEKKRERRLRGFVQQAFRSWRPGV